MKNQYFPVGQFKGLTVVSPEDLDDPELLLEPDGNPAAQAFKKAMFEQVISVASFAVAGTQQELIRMKQLGAVFHMQPTQTGPTTVAVFDDTCGNLIQIFQA